MKMLFKEKISIIKIIYLKPLLLTLAFTGCAVIIPSWLLPSAFAKEDPKAQWYQAPEHGVVDKKKEDITEDDFLVAIRAGRNQAVEAHTKIVKLLIDVKNGTMSPETFYQEVSRTDMPPGKEVRHVLMEVKKDIGNYLGKNGLEAIFGPVYESGGTYAEALILTHRKKVVMEIINKAIVAYREQVKVTTGEYPKLSFYYGEVGGWPTEAFDELKFAGDIDFNFLCGDLDAARDLKNIFDAMIKERYHGRTPEDLDFPCTVHGMATWEVYVGKHGQSFAESVTKKVWEIDFEQADQNKNIEAKEVPFKEALTQMVMEARINKINNSIDDLQSGIISKYQIETAGLDWNEISKKLIDNGFVTERGPDELQLKEVLGDDHPKIADVLGQDFVKFSPILQQAQKIKWPYQPGISLEMIRHFEHDIVGKNVFTDLESFVKAAKYTERGYIFLLKELGDDAKFDPVLKKFVEKLTKWKKDPKAQVTFIKYYFEKIGKPLPFDVQLEINESGKGRTTLEANEKVIRQFWDICRKSMWDGANQVLAKRTHNLKERIKNLGENDLEESKKIYEDLVKLDEMLEIEDRILNDEIAGVHELDPTYKKNIAEFREQGRLYKQKSAEFGHIEYIDPKLAKAYKWVETMLNMGKEFNIKMAGAALLSAPGKLNDVLDFIDDGLMTKLRNGGGEEYIKILRKGQGYYWEEQANQFLKGTGLEGRFDEKFKSMEEQYGQKFKEIENWLNSAFNNKLASLGLQKIQALNRNVNEQLSGYALGKALTTGMMVYSLKEELPLYWDKLMKNDYRGLASEFFRRRVPFGGAVERGVMGDYYGVAWEMTATIIPPLGILAAAESVAESVTAMSFEAYWDEELEKLIDQLYKDATFKIAGVERSGENVKVGQWELIAITSNSQKFDIRELIEKESRDAAEMAQWLSLQKEEQLRDNVHLDIAFDGLFSEPSVRDTLIMSFEKSDPQLGVINAMLKNKIIGSAMKESYMLQRFARLEYLEVAFLNHLKQELEERRSGEQILLSGNFAKAYEELMSTADELDIRPQLEASINEEFGGNVSQFFTSLKDYLRGAVRYLKDEVGIWDIQERLSAFVAKNLPVYQQILEDRKKAEALLTLNNEDEGLRLLTGPYFFDGKPDFDQKAAQEWSHYPVEAKRKMKEKLQAIKKKITTGQLDLSDGTYDTDILNRLIFHETFIELWIHVNSRVLTANVLSYLGQNDATQTRPNLGVTSDSDLAMERVKFHQRSIEDILNAFEKNYLSEKNDLQQPPAGADKTEAPSTAEGNDSILGEIQALQSQMKDLREQALTQAEQINLLKGNLTAALPSIDQDIMKLEEAQTTLRATTINDQGIGSESALKQTSMRIVQARDDIERETLNVCQHYEKMKTTDRIKDLDQLIEEARESFDQTQTTFSTYSSNKDILSQTQTNINQIKSAIQTIKQLQTVMTSVDAPLVKIENSTATLDKLNQIQEGLKKIEQSSSNVTKASGRLTKQAKKQKSSSVADIDSINNQIQLWANEIKTTVSTATAKDASLPNQKTLRKLTKRLLAIKEDLTRPVLTVTGKSTSAMEEIIRQIASLVSAAEVFYDPIENANRNVEICLKGCEDMLAKKATPDNRVKQADCSAFDGTEPQWDEQAQDVHCLCRDRNKNYIEALSRCVTRAEFEESKTNCDLYPGTEPRWHEDEQKTYCDCPQPGEFFYEELKRCANKKDGRMARANCRQWQYAQPVWNAVKEEAQCDCIGDYEWNNAQNACRTKKEIQVSKHDCSNIRYSVAQWNDSLEKPQCFCTGDYETNNAKTGCRLRSDLQVAQASCDPGLSPRWDFSREDVRCYCNNGSWNGSRCVSEYEQEQKRQEQERQWREQEQRRQQQEEYERRQHCNELLGNLNNSSSSNNELLKTTALMFATNADCPWDEIQQAEKGQWQGGSSSSGSSGYGTSGSSSSSGGTSSGGYIIDSGDSWDCSGFPGGVCPGGLFGAPE